MGWRKRLGEVMEGACVTGIILFLVIVDLACTAMNELIERTDWLNPKYEETWEVLAQATHDIELVVLPIFVVEQILHILAFGRSFFSHGWYVLDLVLVIIT